MTFQLRYGEFGEKHYSFVHIINLIKPYTLKKTLYFHDIPRLNIVILFQIAWSNSKAFSAIGSAGRGNETFGGSISDSGESAWTGNDCEQRSGKENTATARRGKTCFCQAFCQVIKITAVLNAFLFYLARLQTFYDSDLIWCNLKSISDLILIHLTLHKL